MPTEAFVTILAFIIFVGLTVYYVVSTLNASRPECPVLCSGVSCNFDSPSLSHPQFITTGNGTVITGHKDSGKCALEQPCLPIHVQLFNIEQIGYNKAGYPLYIFKAVHSGKEYHLAYLPGGAVHLATSDVGLPSAFVYLTCGLLMDANAINYVNPNLVMSPMPEGPGSGILSILGTTSFHFANDSLCGGDLMRMCTTSAQCIHDGKMCLGGKCVSTCSHTTLPQPLTPPTTGSQYYLTSCSGKSILQGGNGTVSTTTGVGTLLTINPIEINVGDNKIKMAVFLLLTAPDGTVLTRTTNGGVIFAPPTGDGSSTWAYLSCGVLGDPVSDVQLTDTPSTKAFDQNKINDPTRMWKFTINASDTTSCWAV